MNPVYTEELSSNKTLALFMVLTVLCGALGAWRIAAAGRDLAALLLLTFCACFLFYTFNYRRLVIHLDDSGLLLRFGVFRWRVPYNNIASCELDSLPTLMRLGGAGIHFMQIRGQYRASFNFLEYPRLVVRFKRPVGPVVDLSFSTRQPEQLRARVAERLGVVSPD